MLTPSPFQFESVPTPAQPEDSASPKTLGDGGRAYQSACFTKFLGKRRTLFIAPTGSGKSLVQVFNAAREILDSSYKQKQVFIVPQLNIGVGFTGLRHKTIDIDGTVYDWDISVDCCSDSRKSVDRIREFLLSDLPLISPSGIGDCAAVVSYSAILAAWAQMTDIERKQAILSTSFRPDEVHHVSGVDESGVAANQLGEFCKCVLDNDGSLHLTTATFFRGDQSVILDSSYMDTFDVFRVQFLEHWQTLGLTRLEFTYHCYADAEDISQQVLSAIRSEPGECPLVIVPSDGQKFFKKFDKWEWIKTLVRGIEEIHGKGNVLDLVSSDRQDADKLRLVSEVQDFTAVVTCSIGREGTDWPACSRIFNTVLDSNAVQPIQKLGRALRRFPGKVNVKMLNYIEHFPAWDSSPDTVREKLSDRFNAVIAASMLDDMLYPIMIPIVPGEKRSPSKAGDGAAITLEHIYGSSRNDLIADLMRGVLSLPDADKTGKSIDDIIERVMRSYESKVVAEAPHKSIKSRLRKEILSRMNMSNPNLRVDGMVVDFIRRNGWDKVVREHVAGRSPFNGGADTDDLVSLQVFLAGVRALDPDTKKRDLIDLAMSGADRPHKRSSLGSMLGAYTLESQAAYDREFSENIRRIAPKWFTKTSEVNKQSLLDLASSGDGRPPQKSHPLGLPLSNYTTPERSSYDPSFTARLQELRPDWFVDAVEIKKQQLLDLAASGGDRPVQRTPLGAAMSNYARPSGQYYDKEFDDKLRNLRPDWFANTAELRKQEIIDLAATNAGRPPQRTPLGSALCDYTIVSKSSYDQEFSQRIRQLRPDWFTRKSAAEKQ